MVNQQDKGKDYYPQAKQGEQEGKPEDYNRNAQKPGAPDHTDTTLKYHYLAFAIPYFQNYKENKIAHLLSMTLYKTHQGTARHI
jgi:hypothetical protein